MKKSIIKSSALKKNANKKPLNYYILDNDVIIWNNTGHFAIKCNKLFFEIEIQQKTPTQMALELPACIINTFNNFKDNTSEILAHTFITIQLNNMNCYLFQNIKHKYLSPININLLHIINNIEDFTPYQQKQNSAILFKNDFFEILLMPIRNTGIKEKIIDIVEILQ